MDIIDAVHRIADLWDETYRDKDYLGFHMAVGEVLEAVGYLHREENEEDE